MSVTGIPGDTLKISFSPKQEYTNLKFKLQCEELEQINDSLYKIKLTSSGNHSYDVGAECTVSDGTSETTYSATSKLEVRIPDTWVIIPYSLSMSGDLSELVIPEITYTDTHGKSHTFRVSDESLSRLEYEGLVACSYVFMIIRNQQRDFYCKCDAQTPMCKRRKLS